MTDAKHPNDSEVVRPEDFGDYASAIYDSFEKLFGVSWPEADASALRAILDNRPSAMSETDREAVQLLRRAYELRSDIERFVQSKQLSPEKWRYLHRLTTDLVVRTYVSPSSRQGMARSLMETPPFALRRKSEAEHWAAERRRIVQFLAYHFPDQWSECLPKAAQQNNSTQTAPKKGNVLLRGIAAALVLGGWILKDRTRTEKPSGARRFRSVVTTVSQDLVRLAKAGYLRPIDSDDSACGSPTDGVDRSRWPAERIIRQHDVVDPSFPTLFFFGNPE